MSWHPFSIACHESWILVAPIRYPWTTAILSALQVCCAPGGARARLEELSVQLRQLLQLPGVKKSCCTKANDEMLYSSIQVLGSCNPTVFSLCTFHSWSFQQVWRVQAIGMHAKSEFSVHYSWCLLPPANCCIAGGPSALLAGDDSKLALGEGTPGLTRDLGWPSLLL